MALKPDTQHSEYAAAASRWAKCRAAIDGEDAVHAAGEAYLPKLKEQQAAEYEAYVMRTPFYNATARTIDGLVGMVFRKAPAIKAPAALDSLKADMTLTESGLEELAEVIAREVIGVGRFGLLVEYPMVIEGPLTQAMAAAQNLRPYCTNYKAESILNWRAERVNNAMQPTMIALQEDVTVWSSAFEASCVKQIRALLLENGTYLQRLFRQEGEKKEWQQFGPDIVPMMNGKPLSAIPFVFFGPAHNGAEVQKPPVYDLVTLNLSHYRSTADLEHGAHFTGLPTAWVSGYTVGANEKLSIGSATAWIFPDPSAKAGYLEFTGQGLGALETRLKEKEAGMAAIGARMLAPEKAAAETSRTMQIRHSGEGAVLSSIANMIGAGLTRVLRIMADWSGLDAEVKVELNEDFIDQVMTAQEVTALVGAWQSGGISFETLFWNLKAGEMVPDDLTAEEEQSRIQIAGPVLTAPPAPAAA